MLGLGTYINLSKENYDFSKCDAQSIIHLINQHGSNLVGLELGVFEASSFCTLLQKCPNIKTLYGVDSFQPYTDYLKEPYDESPAYHIDSKSMEIIKFMAFHSIKHSGFKEKAIILEKDSKDALNDIPDNSLDFIFLDTYMSEKQAFEDVHDWYPKVKKGGLFTGHDADGSMIMRVILNFRKRYNINSPLSVFDNTFVWKKEY
jgi:hypothetical protein